MEKEFVTAIQEKAQAVTVENCMMWIGAVYQLENFSKIRLTSVISSIWTSMALMAMPNNRTRFTDGQPVRAGKTTLHRWSY